MNLWFELFELWSDVCCLSRLHYDYQTIRLVGDGSSSDRDIKLITHMNGIECMQ